ncbi:MAG: hypothetical protein JWM58_4196 [Rhizobium sp.]|nr:hypothetical protein [Rhizobium sp.]
MILWRLSGANYAHLFDGGYGLHNSGRWNSQGNPITYCATSPSLCVLEKLVHVEDPTLLPKLTFVCYDVPDDIAIRRISLADLPADWQQQDFLTQNHGDEWLGSRSSPLMFVPSAVLPVKDSPDVNVLVNHAHANTRRIRTRSLDEFTFDARLL